MIQHSKQWFLVAASLCALPLSLEAKTITVSADGKGDFTNLKEAIAAVPDDAKEETVIHISAGKYVGQTMIPKKKNKITFEGDGVEKTILTYSYNTNEPNPEGVSTYYRGAGVVVAADDFTARNLTFENTSGDHGQALALRIDGDRAIVTQCRLIGWQDTLMVNNGRHYFANNTIAGRVDFIYGSATAVFENCDIHSRNGGYVTAASTPQNRPYGFVFIQCRLTSDSIAWNPATTNPATTEKPWVTPLAALGRPWRPYAAVIFKNCEMGAHIKPEGWDNWGNAENEKTARYFEYSNTGPGARRDKRVSWVKTLSADEAARTTAEVILRGNDGWNPKGMLAKLR